MGQKMYFFASRFLRGLFKVSCGFYVTGQEKMPAEGPVIVAPNHASFLDPMIVGSAFSRPIGYMARKSLFKNKFFGWLIREHFAFPVDNEGDSRSALRTFSERLALGEAVLVFPEGTRSFTGKLQDFKNGVGMIAVRNHAPVLPVYVWGGYFAWPRSQAFPLSHPIVMRVGDPITPRPDLQGREKRAEQTRITEEVRSALLAMEAQSWEGLAEPLPVTRTKKKRPVTPSA